MITGELVRAFGFGIIIGACFCGYFDMPPFAAFIIGVLLILGGYMLP